MWRTPIDYLRGVCDPGDYTSANPNATWIETFSPGEITQDLGVEHRHGDRVHQRRGVSGRILSVTVQGANGQASISGGALRSKLGLPDDRLWINVNRHVTGAIRAKYDGLGCSPGSDLAPGRGRGRRPPKFQGGTIYHSGTSGALRAGSGARSVLRRRRTRRPSRFPTSDVHRLKNGNLRDLRDRRHHLRARRLELSGRLKLDLASLP